MSTCLVILPKKLDFQTVENNAYKLVLTFFVALKKKNGWKMKKK